eukprot:CAMPEP_0198323420 /NCGR_PEP_ID=MMETSP1450-20131203/11665_1 /TAXON_ID=753684 ORGANISM="Madagascaria erythrocladiodes, Strain CCMP3234" /NCGR_SAMPLE_ID=MMETSP1450 /ASSEMBLY_ACC=CAM_ASM_001115 /LENGTH=293 /DNA_ID=CAMNT_0044027117 /DNA_START=122 /DNA_END=1003 /DNA_ORIENTATION=+
MIAAPAVRAACLAVSVAALAPCVLGTPIDPAAGNPNPPVAEQFTALLPDSLREMLTGSGFVTATAQSLLMILVTELGDKTFFIAAIMAMKQSRTHVLVGALAALYLMTILSAAMGKAFPLLLDKRYTSTAAAVLFTYFGFLMLRDWWKNRDSEGENEELQEVEESLKGADDGDQEKIHRSPKPETLSGEGGGVVPPRPRLRGPLVPPTVIRAFTLTFLAEWGDRSQIATIAFAAAKDVWGVTFGGMLGHTICTSIAVMGGRMLAARISERMVSLVGGVLFLVFAVLTATGHLD